MLYVIGIALSRSLVLYTSFTLYTYPSQGNLQEGRDLVPRRKIVIVNWGPRIQLNRHIKGDAPYQCKELTPWHCHVIKLLFGHPIIANTI